MEKDVQEYPFYKVVHGRETLVFIGSKPEYKAMYMRSNNAAAAKTPTVKFKYVEETIFNDDNIDTVTQKIKAATGLDQAYIWCKTHLNNQENATRAFLNEIFASRKIVAKSEIEYAFKCVTTSTSTKTTNTIKNDTVALTFNQALVLFMLPKHVLRPIGFKRQDGSGNTIFFPIKPDENVVIDNVEARIIHENAKTIESFSPMHKTLYVTGDAHPESLYYPPNRLVSQYNTRQLENIRDYKAPSTSSVSVFPSYVQVRVFGGVIQDEINLFKTFGNLEPTDKVPFIKWISVSKTLFKLYKPYINKYKEKAIKDLAIWTRQNKFIKASFEHVVIKVVINQVQIGTLVLETDGSYNIRINYQKGVNATVAAVSQDILNIHSLVNKLVPLVKPNVKALWSPHNFDGETVLVKLTCDGVIKNMSKPLTTSQISDAIDEVNELFSSRATPLKGTVGMLYKRFNGFMEEENINFFMNRYHTLKPKPMINLISHVFCLSSDAAKELYEEWEVLHHAKQGETGAFITQKIVKMIGVNIRPGKSFYEFQIDGVTMLSQVNRIVHGLLYLLHVSGKSKKTGKKSTPAIVVPAENENNGEENMGFELELDLELLFEGNEIPMADDNGQQSPAASTSSSLNSSPLSQQSSPGQTSIDEIKQNMTCPKPRPPRLSKNVIDLPNLKKESLLVHLKKADKELFYVHKDKANKQYVSTCQANANKHPVVMLEHEIAYNNKCFPNAIIDHVNVGTTPEREKRNFYTCPKVWCPKSRVALTMTQFNDEYGGQCPFSSVNEVPILFDKGQFKGRDRHVYLLDPTYHKEHFRSPCCGLKDMSAKLKNNDNGTINAKANGWKYIVDHNVPVAEDRYSMLPSRLHQLFDNRYCGDKNGNNGLVNKQTDCYLIYGLPAKGQPLLQCIIKSIENADMTNQNDLVSLVKTNLDMETFLSLGDGLVCRGFLPSSNMIQDDDLFSKFRAWFLNVPIKQYIKRFNLGNVFNLLKRMPNYSLKQFVPEALRKFHKNVLREFQFYSSYTAYLDYMTDDRIIKNHEYVLPLLQTAWFNPKRYNVLIIKDVDEASTISCPLYQSAEHNFDQEKPTVLLLHQGAYYYEPIHYLHNVQVGSKSSLVIDRIHSNSESNNRASRVITSYLATCANDYFDARAISIRTLLDASAHVVTKQLLNFKFHVVAYYTRTNVIVPLKKPTPMDLNHPSSFEFIDTCLKGFDVTLTEKFAKGVLNAINKIVPGYYASSAFVKVRDTKVALKMSNIDIIIPLAPYKDLKASNIYQEIVKDGAIFTMYEKDDPRRDMVSMNRYVEILYKTFLNELINLINRIPELKDLLDMLRHSENPLPWTVKRVILLDKVKDYAKRLVFRGMPKPSVANVPTGLTSLCSNIGNMSKCQHQCTIVSVKSTRGNNRNKQCQLSIPDENYEYIFERCIEYLLNPINPTKIAPVLTDNELVNDNIVVFSSSDVATHGIQDIISKLSLTGNLNFERQLVDAKEAEIKNIETPNFVAHLKDHDKPSFMDSSPLKGFQLKRYEGSEQKNGGWLFELFTVINKRINAKASMLSEQDLKNLLLKNIKSNHRADADTTFEQLNDNPSFRQHCKINNESSILECVNSSNYSISIYELQILAKIVGVNIFITTRQTQRTPDRMRCLGKISSKDYYLILHQHQPARTSKDVDEFYLYVKTGGKYLFTSADLGPVFSKCVKAKCTNGFFSEDLDDVCPPYK